MLHRGGVSAPAGRREAREQGTEVRERNWRSRECCYGARPALACIIGARLAWTVEMISSWLIPWR